MDFLDDFEHFWPRKFFSMGQIFWALETFENFNFLRFFKIWEILKNLKKLKFSKAPRTQNICPMKKNSGSKNAQNYPKNAFFILRSW